LKKLEATLSPLRKSTLTGVKWAKRRKEEENISELERQSELPAAGGREILKGTF